MFERTIKAPTRFQSGLHYETNLLACYLPYLVVSKLSVWKRRLTPTRVEEADPAFFVTEIGSRSLDHLTTNVEGQNALLPVSQKEIVNGSHISSLHNTLRVGSVAFCIGIYLKILDS